MLIIKKQAVFLLLLLSTLHAFSQQKKIDQSFLYGKWKVIKHDYRGHQKFSIKQADQLNNSLLVINKTGYQFTNVNFISACPFYKWNIRRYDTTISISLSLEVRYTPKELAKNVSYLEAVNKKGKPCNNECLFFLKQDTLISIVGGYTYFRVKIK